jgi:hypothetical protein
VSLVTHHFFKSIAIARASVLPVFSTACGTGSR